MFFDFLLMFVMGGVMVVMMIGMCVIGVYIGC